MMFLVGLGCGAIIGFCAAFVAIALFKAADS